MNVKKFINHIQKRVRIKRLEKKKSLEEKEQETFLKISQNERLEVEEQAMGMRGVLGFERRKLTGKEFPPQMAYDISSNPSLCKPHYVMVIDDHLVVKEKATTIEVLARGYFQNVEQIGVVSINGCLYFVSRW